MNELLNEISQSFLKINFLGVFITFFSKIILCAFQIVIAKIIIRALTYILKKSFDVNLKISERKKETLMDISKSCIKYLVYTVVICNILTTFGINITSLITIAGVGSVAIGLGSQSLIQDIITGMFILFEDQYGVGDIISIDNFTGTVESISIRTTNIRSVDGDLYIIPNGQIKSITNMSKEFNRASITVGIAYEENIDKVIKVMEDELNTIYFNGKINGLIDLPKVLGVVELAESSVNIKIIADTKVGENWSVERELRKFIKNRLDAESICISYPRRVIEILNEKE